ncbi:hypothetical protein KSP39_PZI024131 [Platanthera zijinensis]|uniref:Uncharacterized protein n=1 Tax=Platanthera zijinensis TaxID=2320716 RepID=A0AAP0ATC4_9ASPA
MGRSGRGGVDPVFKSGSGLGMERKVKRGVAGGPVGDWGSGCSEREEGARWRSCPGGAFRLPVETVPDLGAVGALQEVVWEGKIRLKVRGYLGEEDTSVIGLGISGKAATRLALVRGASVLAFDRDEQLIPLEHEPEFAGYANLQTVLGDCEIANMGNVDMIVVSPGVPLEEYALSTLMKSLARLRSGSRVLLRILPTRQSDSSSDIDVDSN